MKVNFARHALALAVLTLSATGAWAADLISSASVSIDNLRYRLIDLDPNDGITPALSINGVWLGSAVSMDHVDYQDSNTPLWPTNQTTALSYIGVLPMQSSGTATAGLPDGTVTSTARSNSLTLNSQLTVQNLQTFTQVNPANSYTYYTSEDGVNGNRTVTTTSSSGASAGLRSSTLAGAAPGTDLNVRSNDSFPKLDLKVTAHTLLVLEGSSKLDISADRSNLQQYIQETGPDVFDPNHIRSSYITAFGEARASVNVALTDDASILYSGLSNSGDLSVAALGAILRYDSDGFRLSQWDDPNTAVTSSSSQSKDWLVQLTNLGDTDKTAYLQTELNTSLSQNISSHTYDTVYTFVPGDPPQVPDVPNVPGIPEPGTCALMGLGLAGVALARRRARITA